MLTHSLENITQNLKLSDKVRQVFVLSLIFLGLCLLINLVSLFIIKFFLILWGSLGITTKIDYWDSWIYPPIKTSICFFLVALFFSFFRIRLHFLIFIFPFLYVIINHSVFFTNLQLEEGELIFIINDPSWKYECIYGFYLGYQDIISYYFPNEGVLVHGIYMSADTIGFYITHILIPSLSFFLITFLTTKIYHFLRT